MSLTNAEKTKLDNACANLRTTKLGTHVKTLEDFVNQGTLDTNANTVVEAINELYAMFTNKDCSSIQVPPPGFFTLWGNDEDGKLYCYYNDEDHPPVFRHVETEGEDEGTLYLYIADPQGDNHYELEIGHYIAVRHLEDYYTKTEIQNGYAIKNHAVNAATYGKGTSGVFGHVKIANNLSTTSTDAIALAAAQGRVLKEAVDGKSPLGHNHPISEVTDLQDTLNGKSNTGHTHDDLATIQYVDGQIANIDGEVDIDLASKADVDHRHGQIDKDGKIGTTANKPLITGTGGAVTTGDFGTGQNQFARGNHTHTGSELKLGASGSDANVSIQDAVNAKPDLGTSATTAAKGNHNHSGTYVDGVNDKNSTDGSALAEIKANNTVKGTIHHPKVLSNPVSSSLKKIAVNTDGHITGTDTVSASDLPSGIPTSKIDGLDNTLENKVDKVSGKSLLSDTEITRLSGIGDNAVAKKRVLGFLITSPRDPDNQPMIEINQNTKLKVRLYNSENAQIDEGMEGIGFPINLKVHYVINGVNKTLTTTDSGAEFNVGLSPGDYTVHFAFTGSGNYYPAYRSILLKVI